MSKPEGAQSGYQRQRVSRQRRYFTDGVIEQSVIKGFKFDRFSARGPIMSFRAQGVCSIGPVHSKSWNLDLNLKKMKATPR